MRLSDAIVSPPPDYSIMTYESQLKNLGKDCLKSKGVGERLKKIAYFLRLLLMIMASYILYPIAYILKKVGYRFVTIDLTQIGSVIYLDLFLREDILYKNTPRHKILLLASYHRDGNRYILDLYKPYAIFIRNPFLKLVLSPFFVSKLFKEDNSFKFDLTHPTEIVSHNIWNKYQEKYKKPLISFPDKDIRAAQEQLNENIPIGQKFVALHVRDNGFYNIPSQNTRNAEIQSYLPAIKYLINKGYAVIRLGDKSAKSINSMTEECGNLLFDYAHSDIQSEMMDAYILSHCEFYIGLASGPASMPMLFGINSVNVNWYNVSNAPNFLKGDITTFKVFKYKENDTLVPFEKLFHEPFNLNPTQHILNEHGVYFSDNTEEDILNTIQEFLKKPSEPLSENQRLAQSKILPSNYAYGAKGQYSNTILNYYWNKN